MDVIEALSLGLFLDLGEVDVGNSSITIKDTRDLLKSGTLGLRVDEVHPDKFDSDPALFVH